MPNKQRLIALSLILLSLCFGFGWYLCRSRAEIEFPEHAELRYHLQEGDLLCYQFERTLVCYSVLGRTSYDVSSDIVLIVTEAAGSMSKVAQLTYGRLSVKSAGIREDFARLNGTFTIDSGGITDMYSCISQQNRGFSSAALSGVPHFPMILAAPMRFPGGLVQVGHVWGTPQKQCSLTGYMTIDGYRCAQIDVLAKTPLLGSVLSWEYRIFLDVDEGIPVAIAMGSKRHKPFQQNQDQLAIASEQHGTLKLRWKRRIDPRDLPMLQEQLVILQAAQNLLDQGHTERSKHTIDEYLSTYRKDVLTKFGQAFLKEIDRVGMQQTPRGQ